MPNKSQAQAKAPLWFGGIFLLYPLESHGHHVSYKSSVHPGACSQAGFGHKQKDNLKSAEF